MREHPLLGRKLVSLVKGHGFGELALARDGAAAVRSASVVADGDEELEILKYLTEHGESLPDAPPTVTLVIPSCVRPATPIQSAARGRSREARASPLPPPFSRTGTSTRCTSRTRAARSCARR